MTQVFPAFLNRIRPVESRIVSHTSFYPRIATLAAILIVAGTAACTVPLAPGYRISKESREIQFVSGATSALQIRGHFTLQNSGSANLKFIDVLVPTEKPFGLKNLHVQVNGRDVTPAPLPAELQYDHPNTLRIPLDPVWEQKQKRELAIEYVLSFPGDSGSRIAESSKMFSLGYRGWFVDLQPPNHALSPFPSRPDRTAVVYRVPSNFLLLARGTRAGKKQMGDETEYRYMLRTQDLAPFVVAGQYVESATSPRR